MCIYFVPNGAITRFPIQIKREGMSPINCVDLIFTHFRTRTYSPLIINLVFIIIIIQILNRSNFLFVRFYLTYSIA